MSDIKHTEIPVEELARAINTQAKLLEEIVKAADHIVRAYVELTKKNEPKAKEEVIDVKPEEAKQ
jgi:hypothetical protein